MLTTTTFCATDTANESLESAAQYSRNQHTWAHATSILYCSCKIPSDIELLSVYTVLGRSGVVGGLISGLKNVSNCVVLVAFISKPGDANQLSLCV